jgi:hypothetical protein
MFDDWAENPKREPFDPSREMMLGSAAHHLLLGEDHFKLRYIATPLTYRDKKTAVEKPWHNGADYCQQWNDKAALAGKLTITQRELGYIVSMARSLAIEPLVKAGLLRGLIEHSGFFRDPETGLWIKVRPDVIPLDTGEYVDLKTTRDSTTPAVQSSIRSYGYHQQGALIWEVCDGLEMHFESFTLAFIETSRPWCSRMVPLDEHDLARGRYQNRSSMRKIARCIDTGHWPGPGEGELHALPLSHDERERIDARLKAEGIII